MKRPGRMIFQGVAFLMGIALLGTTACRHTKPFRDADGHLVPGSIATMEMLPIGGMEQSLWFRGVDRDKPALVLVHGGPGASEGMLFRHYTPELEKHFLVVYWEQRGSGRSYDSDIPLETMTIDRMVEDLDEVVDLVRERFDKDRVIVIGHSWGTVLGTIYAHEHPDKLSAYVGVAQIADFAGGERRSYEWTLDRARERGDKKAIKALEAMAPAPDTIDEELEKGEWAQKFGGVNHADLTTGDLVRAAWGTDEANFMDMVKFSRGLRFSMEALYEELTQVDLTELQKFETPIVLMLGRHDWHVPAVDAAAWFETIEAPKKELIWFEGSAHNPPYEEPEAFVNAMIGRVLPLVDREENPPQSVGEED